MEMRRGGDERKKMKKKVGFINIHKTLFAIFLLLAASVGLFIGIALCCLIPFISDTEIAGGETQENTDGAGVYTIKDEDLITVGFSQIGSESQWRTANTASIQNALTKEKGYFLIYNNARQKQENQIKVIRSFISQQVDYIVFAPIAEDGWDTVLLEAEQAGIPVILVDRKIDSPSLSYFTTWVGADTRQEGEEAALWLENYLQEKGREEEEIRILALEGTAGSSSQEGRSEGFDLIAKKHKNWTVLERQDADFTNSRAKEIMEGYIEKYDDFDVVLSQNDDMTFGAIEAMQEAGISIGEDGDVVVISFDATREGLQMVQDGLILVDVECNPLQGEKVEEVIRKLERGELVQKFNRVEENVFTQENVDEFIDQRRY